MAALRDIVVDCRRAAPLARFWAQVPDGSAIAPYDEAERARLRALGVDDVEDDPTVLLEGPTGAPRLWFQVVPEPRTVKNRVHLDLAAADVGAEVERLLALGAVLHEPPSPGPDLVTLHDPEGNEFCIVAA